MSGWYWIMLGGAVGAWLRYVIGNVAMKRFPRLYPVGTFLINVTGSFLLGLVAAWTEFGEVSPVLWRLLGIGVLGAYTTFSTFGVEAVTLFERRQPVRAVVYVLGSVVLGVIGAWLGMTCYTGW